jgi:NAD(P)H-hydrate epimerase
LELPVAIYDTDGVRRIDRSAIEDAGVAGYTLMNRAAQAALELATQAYSSARRWQVICGGGNNGGDGYVLARLARAQGLDVSVVAMVPPASLAGDAAIACRDFTGAGGHPHPWEGRLDPDAELLVDAILGSGLSRDVEGPFKAAITQMNAHAAPVLALDVPSGLSSDTGRVLGAAVRADRTLTFVGLKCGLFLGSAADFIGELSFAGLDIPAGCHGAARVILRRIDESVVRGALPPRRRSAHKGDFGHLLLVGGGRGMPGAIRLSAEAALRSGAGRVTVLTHPANQSAIVAGRPEIMCYGVEGPADLEPLLARGSTLALGPGLGTDAWGAALCDAALRGGLPAVVDADALNLLAQNPRRQDGWILTPHPGEAGRLLGQPASTIQADRLASLHALQSRYGGTVVLKGAGTLVSSASGPAWVTTSGNPGMASPGMGDVLTGVIAGLLAQGLAPETAAVTGVEVQARAGDRAARGAPRGLLASDLLAEIRTCVNP